MARKKVGRPTIMTDELISKLEDAFAYGCTDEEACLYADIGMKTLYNYQLKYPEFVQRKEQLKQNPVLLARQSVVNALKADPDLSLKFLERKAKKEFSLRSEVSGPEGVPLDTGHEAIRSIAEAIRNVGNPPNPNPD